MMKSYFLLLLVFCTLIAKSQPIIGYSKIKILFEQSVSEATNSLQDEGWHLKKCDNESNKFVCSLQKEWGRKKDSIVTFIYKDSADYKSFWFNYYNYKHVLKLVDSLTKKDYFIFYYSEATSEANTDCYRKDSNIIIQIRQPKLNGNLIGEYWVKVYFFSEWVQELEQHSEKPWAINSRYQFLIGCMQGARNLAPNIGREYCSCALAQGEAKYEADNINKLTREQATELITPCVEELKKKYNPTAKQ